MSKHMTHLRSLFKAKFQEQNNPDFFHPADLKNVDDDCYLEKYLIQHKDDANAALEMLWGALLWRKDKQVNEICEDNINLDYIKEGIFYPYGRDNDGCLNFIFHGSKYTRGSKNLEDVKRCFIYWFERIFREENGMKVTFMYNAIGAGLQNTDLALIRFVISLINYYPDSINHLIGFEVPWILNRVFILIKQMLPPALAKKMKIVNKTSIREYFQPDQLLQCMGGTSDYQFKFEHETMRKLSLQKTKSVYFDNIKSIVTVCPCDFIKFGLENGSYTGTLTVSNCGDELVAYKIRTTAPQKFIVDCCVGILPFGSSKTVKILLHHDYKPVQAASEKFLVVCLKVPKCNISDINNKAIWESDFGQMEEYKLKCSFVQDLVNPDLEVSNINLAGELTKIQIQLRKMKVFIYAFAGVNSLLLYAVYTKLCEDKTDICQ